jgi:hypothetical protein
MSMMAMGIFLMFLTAYNHKYLWLMLALSSVLVRQAAEPRQQEIAPCT